MPVPPSDMKPAPLERRPKTLSGGCGPDSWWSTAPGGRVAARQDRLFQIDLQMVSRSSKLPATQLYFSHKLMGC